MNRFSAAWNTFFNYNSPIEQWGDKIFTAMGIEFGSKNLGAFVRKGYKSNNQVYSIINRIAEKGASIPLRITATLTNGDVVEVLENDTMFGEFYEFVHRPNPEDNYRSFMYAALVFQLTTGNSIQLGIKPTGFSEFYERWNLMPQYIQPEVINNVWGPSVKQYLYTPNGGTWTLDPENIMHLRRFDPDMKGANAYMGMSPLEAAIRTVVSSNENITARASIIKNKGAMGLLTSRSERALTTPEKDMMDQALKKRIGGGTEFGSVKVTSGNFDFIKMSMSPSDLKLLEMGILDMRDLCSIYGVNSRMFNDPNGSTYNNAKEDQRSFYTNGVFPPLDNELDHFNRFFVPGWNERFNVKFKVEKDISEIEVLQEDQFKEIEKIRKQAETIREILKGIGTLWTVDSAKEQLIYNFGMTEDEAGKLIDKELIILPPPPTQ
jgi:HK97 family phage portal protein